jgi:hypothetical protein
MGLIDADEETMTQQLPKCVGPLSANPSPTVRAHHLFVFSAGALGFLPLTRSATVGHPFPGPTDRRSHSLRRTLAPTADNRPRVSPRSLIMGVAQEKRKNSEEIDLFKTMPYGVFSRVEAFFCRQKFPCQENGPTFSPVLENGENDVPERQYRHRPYPRQRRSSG